MKEAVIREMPHDLQTKFFGRHSAIEIFRNGRTACWVPNDRQKQLLTTICHEHKLNVKRLPTPAQLAELLRPRQLNLYYGYRPFDRKMAVKVLRWVEVHGPCKGKRSPIASRMKVEGLVDEALDLIEEERGMGHERVEMDPLLSPLLEEHTGGQESQTRERPSSASAAPAHHRSTGRAAKTATAPPTADAEMTPIAPPTAGAEMTPIAPPTAREAVTASASSASAAHPSITRASTAHKSEQRVGAPPATSGSKVVGERDSSSSADTMIHSREREKEMQMRAIAPPLLARPIEQRYSAHPTACSLDNVPPSPLVHPPPTTTHHESATPPTSYYPPPDTSSKKGTTPSKPTTAHILARTTLLHTLHSLQLLPLSTTEMSDQQLVALAREHARKRWERVGVWMEREESARRGLAALEAVI
ncbi:hypothetical protein Tdes44962_MAKER09025 [Teratosphaeria destructans]|uniref:Uncharacterized protein n=1 Tax=Teratosphaeria destructans TaxID=418781 RepID=A0A9W7W3I2_9PEZI|nr:hypothetical protein Tdes44962_MAKER09025 [Teratosphaeria destructans]